MNVRFFAGTKADYLSLPTPHNPLGLYFCADTKELFWADRLLTDGIRVVPTQADLPELSCAADGIVYYVTETRNGYILSPDRTEWLQTIYAPATDAYKVPESEIYNTVTTVGAVRDIETKIYNTIDERIANIEVGTSGSGIKAVYFAGVKFDELDGIYTIDRLCALRALGFVIPEDQDEFELVTKEYVDEQIRAITNIDLSEYAKKTDLAGLATKVELQEAVESIDITNITEQLTTINEQITNVSEQVTNIEETYVSNTTLEENYITKQEIQNTYVTEQYVTNNYITQAEADAKITTVVETQVNEVVTKEIETKVTEIIQEKVDNDELTVKAESISYGDFEDDLI